MRKTICIMLCAAVMSISGCGGCSEEKKEFTAYRIHKVKRVFAQGVGGYSVMSEDENREIKHQLVTSSTRPARIFADVPENGEMWVEVEEKLATIHVRSINDIGGGKFTVQNGKSSVEKTTNIVK